MFGIPAPTVQTKFQVIHAATPGLFTDGIFLEPEEILYDEDGPKTLFGMGSGNYKVNVQISQRPPDILNNFFKKPIPEY